VNEGGPAVSGLARGLRLGQAALEAGTGAALQRLGVGASLPAGPGSRALLRALFELRGAALKVAQFLSLESDLLPAAVAEEYARACHRVPPMGAELARARVRAEIGPVEQHFAHFDPTPLAAASLGQVHAATTRDGRAVAVKVQYPGMAESVRTDLRLLRCAAGVLPHRRHYHRLLDEVESRLLEECDYRLEAEALAWFRARVAVEGVTVAEVVPPLSASFVLCTARLAGRHLDDWLASAPDAALRDLAAQRLYDTFVQSLHVLGRLHADPNPGNILFGPEGRVGLLDFGCTRWIRPDCQELVTRIWRAAVRHDDAAGHAAYRDMGLLAHLSAAETREVDASLLKPFRDWLAIPFRCDRFDFGQRGFVGAGRRLFARLVEHEALVGIRPEFVLVNRTLYGLYRVFERLGARVRCQTAWTSG
jgi:predicted unusual protein kinase regulating ubiquinone biosynthesis (AarF/ABC1/UbiB family)